MSHSMQGRGWEQALTASGMASADNSRTILGYAVADVNTEHSIPAFLLLVLAQIPSFVEGAMFSVPFDLVFAFLHQCCTSAQCL